MESDPPLLFIDNLSSYLRLAFKEATKSEYVQRHGAVLVKGGAVINKSFNTRFFNKFGKRFHTHKMKYENSQGLIGTQHAEIRAILGVDKKKTQGATIYVVRIGADRGKFPNRLRYSKPCLMCQEAMRFVGIKKVIYSINDGIKEMVL